MCLFTSKIYKRFAPSITLHKIVTYKIFVQDSSPIRVFTPYQWAYVCEDISKLVGTVQRAKIKGDFLNTKPGRLQIYEGIHSFTSCAKAKRQMKPVSADILSRCGIPRPFKYILCRCEIPRFSKYFVGVNEDIVSNRLVIKEIL